MEDLTECSNKMFKDLRRVGYLSEKQLNYYSLKYKKACNLGKLYLLLKIHKRLHNVQGRLVTSNCGTSTEKASVFLDNHLKPIMESSWFYIQYLGDFIDKINRIKNILKDAILVTTDVIELYPRMPHIIGLKALKNALDARDNKSVPAEKLLKIKCAPSYTCIFMSEFEASFF